ncbi:sulfotransferase [Falsiphaeobacter marinintestinus]|uniref:sulfotransferase n=1 Tax=Falsiphaeobacter marinintestinus TaxID=1492905 RepID=UPI0011B3C6DB|nr:sulfotransferase [Phaeobacter marinintestinus]
MTMTEQNAETMTEPRVLCVGTHHKTGTVWMRRVFREIGQLLDIPMIGVHRPEKWGRVPDTGRVIVVNWAGRFAPELRNRPDARLFHLIRDPRDVLLSGARYHESTEMQTEKFLFKERPDLGGKTYQAHMQGLATLDDKLAFEMGEMHLKTLTQMLEWDAENPRALDLRYEDLIGDEDCALFTQVLKSFGFNDEEVQKSCEIFVKNSLFGGHSGGRTKTHVKSGKAAQWVTALPPTTAQLYLERHGDDLITLGYETDKTWIDRLNYQPKSETQEPQTEES